MQFIAFFLGKTIPKTVWSGCSRCMAACCHPFCSARLLHKLIYLTINKRGKINSLNFTIIYYKRRCAISSKFKNSITYYLLVLSLSSCCCYHLLYVGVITYSMLVLSPTQKSPLYLSVITNKKITTLS